MEQLRPFPSSGTVVTELRIVDVLDKGKAAVIIIGTTTKEASSGNIIAENELTTFVRGAGGFGKTEYAQLMSCLSKSVCLLES